MQNIIKYPKRRYVVLQKLGSIFKSNLNRYKIINIASMKNNCNNVINKLCFPVSCRLYIEVHKELSTIRSLLLKNGTSRIYFSPRLCTTRNFSTSPRLSDKDKTEKSSTESKSSNNSYNNPKRSNSEIIILLMKLCMFFIALSFLIYVFYMIQWQRYGFMWNDFVNEMLLKGEVREIIISEDIITVHFQYGAIYKGRKFPHKKFIIHDPELCKTIEKKIRDIERTVGIKMEDGISIRYVHKDEYGTILTLLIYSFVLFGQFGRQLRIKNIPTVTDLIRSRNKATYTLVEPFSGKGVHFKDVLGLKEAKIEVMEFVDYLKHPERYQKLGAKVPRGALLLGPPGCGKTLLAKAVATEASVPFFSMNGSEFIEVIGGVGAARVRDLFADAKKRAPSIIYIDEIDAVGKRRLNTEVGNNESERTLNQLLVEMDGMVSAADVIVLASTNREDVLDKALLRRGRFDRHILIDLPTLEERKQIFEYYLNSLTLKGKPAQYSGYLAYLSPGFTGADIANVCNEAALHAARENNTMVTNNDLAYAIDKVIGGMLKKSNTLTPSTKKVVAYHEAGHALVGWLLENTACLLKVTIVPRINMSLGYAQYSEMDRKLRTKEELFQQICIMLGGRVAESIIFNKISTGAQNDLEKVTKIAYAEVQQYGMSPSVGLISFPKESTNTSTKKPYSKKMANLMDLEVRRIITEAYKTTEKLILDNKDKLTLIAEALLEKETLTYDDIEKLIGPPPYKKKRLVEPAEFVSDAEPVVLKPTPL